jgi:hypothetical protein
VELDECFRGGGGATPNGFGYPDRGVTSLPAIDFESSSDSPSSSDEYEAPLLLLHLFDALSGGFRPENGRLLRCALAARSSCERIA